MDFSKVELTYDEQTKIFTTPKVDIYLHPKGVGDLMFESMKKNFGKISHVNVDDGTTMTFDDLYERSVRAAIEMRKLGIKPGDVVTICSHNQFNCAAAFVATTFLGAVNASLDPTLAESDIEHLMAQVTPKMIFVSEEREELLHDVVTKLALDTKLVVFGSSKSNLSFATFVTPKEDEASFEPYAVEDLTKDFAILFSSGSTGLPKGICLSHKYFLYHTSFWVSEVAMSITTLYWISATSTLISSICHGKIRAMTKAFDPVKAWDFIETYKINMLQLPPFQAINFVSNRPEGFVSSLNILGIGGGGTTTEHYLKMRSALPKSLVLQGFATTETGLIFNPMPPQSIKKPQSIGVPLLNVSYKIVDPETEQVLGFNERGELRIKSDYCFNGYYKKDSSDVWDADGYFKTGDISYYDEEYCFFIVDRIKEMFKYKGYHITPVKLESVLLDHPDIDIAVIVGVPHSIDENHISAVAVPKKGSKITPEELKAYYNDKSDDRHMIRGGVHFFASIPMTPTGKINRPATKKMLLSRINDQVNN